MTIHEWADSVTKNHRMMITQQHGETDTYTGPSIKQVKDIITQQVISNTSDTLVQEVASSRALDYPSMMVIAAMLPNYSGNLQNAKRTYHDTACKYINEHKRDHLARFSLTAEDIVRDTLTQLENATAEWIMDNQTVADALGAHQENARQQLLS